MNPLVNEALENPVLLMALMTIAVALLMGMVYWFERRPSPPFMAGKS